MSNSRTFLPLVVGWLCLSLAVMLLVLCGVMVSAGAPAAVAALPVYVALLLAVIAAGCLMPGWRTIILRAIGATLCVACAAALIMSFTPRPEKGPARSPRRGPLVAVALAGAAMAVKGRWPSREAKIETKDEPEDAQVTSKQV